jgi:hypothetical protein
VATQPVELTTTTTPPHTPPHTPTHQHTNRILRSHSSPTLELANSLRYTDLQEHEAAARELRRNKPQQGRKRRAVSSLSDSSPPNVVVSNQFDVAVPSGRPLQKRARPDPAHGTSVEEMSTHGRLYDHINNGNRQQWTLPASTSSHSTHWPPLQRIVRDRLAGSPACSFYLRRYWPSSPEEEGRPSREALDHPPQRSANVSFASYTNKAPSLTPRMPKSRRAPPTCLTRLHLTHTHIYPTTLRRTTTTTYTSPSIPYSLCPPPPRQCLVH